MSVVWPELPATRCPLQRHRYGRAVGSLMPRQPPPCRGLAAVVPRPPPPPPATFASNVKLIGGDENSRTPIANGTPSMEINCIVPHGPTKCDHSWNYTRFQTQNVYLKKETRNQETKKPILLSETWSGFSVISNHKKIKITNFERNRFFVHFRECWVVDILSRYFIF